MDSFIESCRIEPGTLEHLYPEPIDQPDRPARDRRCNVTARQRSLRLTSATAPTATYTGARRVAVEPRASARRARPNAARQPTRRRRRASPRAHGAVLGECPQRLVQRCLQAHGPVPDGRGGTALRLEPKRCPCIAAARRGPSGAQTAEVLGHRDDDATVTAAAATLDHDRGAALGEIEEDTGEGGRLLGLGQQPPLTGVRAAAASSLRRSATHRSSRPSRSPPRSPSASERRG